MRDSKVFAPTVEVERNKERLIGAAVNRQAGPRQEHRARMGLAICALMGVQIANPIDFSV